MKILHTADWHIGQFKGPVVDGVNLRSLDTMKCLEYMVEVAQKERPDVVCISGDIFHQEQIGPVRYSDEMINATNIITALAYFAKYVIVMRGTPNHDGSGQFRVLRKMLLNIKNVSVVTTPGVIKTPLADFACIPGFDKQEFRAQFPGLSADEENLAWTKYISDMVFALRAECEKTPILMAHYTVPGCNMESGQTSFFTNFEPVIPREALMAARYEAVLLGHIHRPQIIEGFDNVFYSGAINAMNFNDEGQERGFWIHEFNEKGTLAKGHRYTTPYRQFHTITWDPDEVGDYIREGAMYLHRTGISEEVTDKIVRVRYSCTSEQKKALNIPLLQKNLYELGAFYVADIEAESTIDITNRGLLSEESDPRLNLKKWLEEKTFKNPDKIVELAEPIIAEAMKQSTTAEIHGVFKPVSISVRNYRNYKEESFDFSDISFCTINGVNGAGKSSLFMDAIVDCLFEETREGDCKAWIRGTEDARSGSIEFIFDIGEKRFRVVRTRTKSGKPTLNLSQYQEESADWMNLSKERIIDTQAEIEKLLGIDSMTFRSCALIMQDQYGLFLQAKKDERIAILGNLLGHVREKVAKEDAKRYQSAVAEHELQEIKASYSERILEAENYRNYRRARIAEIRQQEEFMKNSGCPDIENASCRFLIKAAADVKELPEELDNLKKCEKEIAVLITDRDQAMAEKQKEIRNIGFNLDYLNGLTATMSELGKYAEMKLNADQSKPFIARLETEKEMNDKNIRQCKENLSQVKLKASEITETVNELSESVDRREQIKQQMAHLQTYVEQEKELPVYEERKQHVLERIESMEKEMEKLTDRKFILSSQLTGMDTMLEKMKETFSTNMVEETDRQIRSNKETLGELQIQKGVLLERLENIDTMRGEISMLNNGIAVTAGRADCYEALKQAFSQDGVPHQIIRNIIPHITDTTNNILGQMTGGTMGVEFVMERTVKGKDGDKATLDVLINEYSKTTLPYASKSGGEKVKASLAVILALSEIKATAAGIQLGMLFIDEPPFLDDEGAQAYVDALETIRDRYSDVKIMAITHDDAMKARFGQAVTVIKTDDGSKVIY